MMPIMARVIAPLLLVVQFSSTAAGAYDLGVARETVQPPALTSEYIYRNDTDEVLIPVYLLGAVSKPGLYHISNNTDLIALLTLAGGTLAGAQVDKIVVRGQGGGSAAAKREIRFDLERALHDGEASKVELASHDLIYVTPGKTPITTEILTFLGIATGVLSVIVSGILVSQNVGK